MFFMIPNPEITSNLLLPDNTRASLYYQSALNGESAEVWLQRGFERMPYSCTNDPAEADVFLMAGYFHLARLKVHVATDFARRIMK
jgi:hypothetical protein